MFHKAAILKGNAAGDTDMHADNDVEQFVDIPTLEVEFSGHEVEASDNEDKIHTEVEDIESPALQ